MSDELRTKLQSDSEVLRGKHEEIVKAINDASAKRRELDKELGRLNAEELVIRTQFQTVAGVLQYSGEKAELQKPEPKKVIPKKKK
jgi:hypothetical protein